MYKYLLRSPLFYVLNPSRGYGAYKLLLRTMEKSKLIRGIVRLTHSRKTPDLSQELFGITFPNPIGMAAGFDTDAEVYNSLFDLGFGFVEIGSLTPDAQTKETTITFNSREKSIIHRTWYQNKGVRYAIKRIQNNPKSGIVAANLVPHLSSTRDADMVKDFEKSFSLLYDFVDLFIINVSFTNTDGLEPIQELTEFKSIIDPLLDFRLYYGEYKPLLVKISPDTTHGNLDSILDYCMYSGVDGIVVGNASKERGGLSGAPLFDKTIEQISYIKEYTKGRFPIVGCGGIMTPEQASQMLKAGASLLEIHSAFMFEGPSFVKKTLKYLQNENNAAANS